MRINKILGSAQLTSPCLYVLDERTVYIQPWLTDLFCDVEVDISTCVLILSFSVKDIYIYIYI